MIRREDEGTIEHVPAANCPNCQECSLWVGHVKFYEAEPVLPPLPWPTRETVTLYAYTDCQNCEWSTSPQEVA